MNTRNKGLLLSLIGVIILSPDSLLIRLVDLDDFSLIFYRSALPVITVFLFLLYYYKSAVFNSFILIGLPGVVYAILYAITHICFVYSTGRLTWKPFFLRYASLPASFLSIVIISFTAFASFMFLGQKSNV